MLPGCQAIEGLIDRIPVGQTDEPQTVYIPGSRTVTPLMAGEAAPESGYLLTPALMLELGPCLADALADEPDWQPTRQ